MKKNIQLLILLLLTIMPLQAIDKQFYFIGQYHRLGSLSSDAKTQQGIYLRWDLIEGDLPSEIQQIELIRDDGDRNTTLLNVDANASMSSNDIRQMFSAKGQERRLFESINFIASNDDPQCTKANISNIGQKVKGCLQNNYWSFLASRVNFNIAQARYRAYLDTTFASNKAVIRYRLVGKQNNQRVVLGETTVNLVAKSVLPAKNFSQVKASHCNDGRYALDDYRVALSWSHGGDKSSFFMNGLMISGYDLYYSTKVITSLPNDFAKTDIANEASSRVHNAKGDIDLSSIFLKKANDTLITLGTQEVNTDKPIYVESMESLKKRGFKPGEKRYYFLVPRDFTGNYGPSISLVVTIPDLLPPPMPINPRAIEEDAKSTLLWEDLNLHTYANYYKDVMKVCGTNVHTKKDRVQFVDINESCTAGNGLTVNFNIAKYNIYRFENLQEAASFQDSDLDGYADKDERASATQCNATRHPVNPQLNHLVSTVQANNQADILRYHDTTVNHSKVYWYRIASVTESNITSPLTAPIRSFVRNRQVLDAPVFTVTSSRLIVELKDNDGERDLVVEDNSNQHIIDKVVLEYKGEVYPLLRDNNRFKITAKLRNLVTFSDSNEIIKVIFYSNNMLQESYLTAVSTLFTLNTLYGNDKKTPIGYQIATAHHRLDLRTRTTSLIDGGIVSGSCFSLIYSAAYYQALQARGGCIETTQRLGLDRYAYSRNCSPQQEEEICPTQAHRGDLISLRIQECSASGSCSQPAFVNPILLSDAIPNRPNISKLELRIADKNASVLFTPQLEKVKGTMLYLYKKGDLENAYTKIVPHIGNKSLEPIESTIENVLGLTNSSTWCLKAKTIGLNGKVSPWSATICEEIEGINPLPDNNLAWPQIVENIEKRSNVQAEFDEVAEAIELDMLPVGSSKFCVDYLTILQKLERFVVYRQTIDTQNQTSSKFVQVTPLIDGEGSCKDDILPREGLLKDMSNNLYFDQQGEHNNLKFRDRYPYVVGETYRYLLLYFDEESKEPSGYALSNDVTTN